MNDRLRVRGYCLAIAIISVCVTLGASGLRAQTASPAPEKPGVKTARQAFKNIQVLKDIPADQLIPTMQFIAASLGVECEYCHVQDAFEKDDKETKQTARKMMQMMFAINKDNFNGRREVTCNSCHRGATEPVSVPAVAGVEAQPAPGGASVHGMSPSDHEGEKTAAAPALPTADEILAKYAEAAGGAAALGKITSRIEKGNIAAFGGHSRIEVYAKAPDKRMSVMHGPQGDSITAFDGRSGWLRQGTRTRPMSAAENEAAGLDATFAFPVRVKEIFKQFRERPPEEVNGHPAYLLFALRPGQPPVKLYFDEQSGLLVREVRYAETALGRLPTQIDYADYRDAEGLKIPFRWTLARPGGAFTIQVDDVQQNVRIDDSKFAEPPSEKQ